MTTTPNTLSANTVQTSVVGNREVSKGSKGVFPVMNPATGQVIAQVPRMGTAEAREAIAAADDAFGEWRRRGPTARGRILRDWAERIRGDVTALAQTMTCEQGKPLHESRGEIEFAATFLDWFAEEGRRSFGAVIPTDTEARKALTVTQPIGVGAAITPWNFPAAMITRKVAPALAAGCPVVLKPAEQTPLTALALGRHAFAAGVPTEVLSILTGDAADAPEIGLELTTNDTVRKFSFTGSTEIGALLLGQCAPTVKSVSLELGGNSPYIVFSDADIDIALKGLLDCKFRNAGQTCVSANRILVASSIYEEFVEALGELAQGLTVGNGLHDGVDVGPLIDAQAIDKVDRHVSDALALGGRLIAGGHRLEDLGPRFYSPTVIADLTPEMDVWREETFGPAAFVGKFDSEEEAVQLANSTPFGLAAYFFTTDSDRIWRVGDALESGILGINTGLTSTATAPFGGFKRSGLGREGGQEGLHDWLETKYICQGVNPHAAS